MNTVTQFKCKSRKKYLMKKKELFLRAICQNLAKDSLRLSEKWNLQQHHIIGDTYLLTAAKIGDLSTVKKLLDNGADPESPNLSHQSPLVSAIIKHHNEIVETICDNLITSSVTPTKGALQWAIAFGNIKAIKMLLMKWPSLINQKELKSTALHIAISKGTLGTLLELLKYGPDFRECCPFGNTPLQLAFNRLKNEVSSFIDHKNKMPIEADVAVGALLDYVCAINYQTDNAYGFCQSDMELIRSNAFFIMYYLESKEFQCEKATSSATKLFLEYKL